MKCRLNLKAPRNKELKNEILHRTLHPKRQGQACLVEKIVWDNEESVTFTVENTGLHKISVQGKWDRYFQKLTLLY